MSALHKVATEEVLDVQPSASIVAISPDAAKRWLAQNTKNRPLKKTKLPEFIRDMKAGRWQLTGEAIKFDAAGNLLDGQNRLTAIIESGVTVPMFVIRGLPSEAQEVMDSGAPRSAADALALHDYAGSKNLATAANAYAAWTSGFFKHAMWQSSPKFTHSEVVRIIRGNPGLVDASRITAPLRGDLPLGHGAVAAACYRFSQIDPDDTVEFFARVHDLRTQGKGDPINALLKRTADARELRQRIWTSTSLFLLVRSWNAFRKGERLEKFQLGSNARGWVRIPEPR